MTDPQARIDGVRVAVAQVRPVVGSPAANLRLAGRWVYRAAERGADLVVFPECFVQGYSLRPTVIALAEPLGGPSVEALRSLAKASGVAIVAGFIERPPRGAGDPYNSAVVVDRDGRLAGVYRKSHLYEQEDGTFARGNAFPTFDLRIVPRGTLRVGVCICADIEYPEVVRLLALGGARLVCVPSADMEPYRAQQAANMASRAIENNLHVALANTVDRRPSVTFFGGSGIAGPDGALVSAGYGRQRMAVATLSEAAVERSGGAGAYLRTRRPEIYAGLLDQG